MSAIPFKDTGFDAPANLAAAVTPDNSNDIGTPSRALYVGTGGNVAVHMAADGAASPTSVTFANVPDGTLLPVRVRRVLSTGTTASNIVALW